MALSVGLSVNLLSFFGGSMDSDCPLYRQKVNGF
jgi:hypothetical protein